MGIYNVNLTTILFNCKFEFNSSCVLKKIFKNYKYAVYPIKPDISDQIMSFALCQCFYLYSHFQ